MSTCVTWRAATYWSPTWQPVTGIRLDAYECRHGAGYTRIRSEYGGIAAQMLYFVPPGQPEGAPCELWLLRLSNLTDRVRRLGAFSYAEWSYWDAITDQQNLDWAQQIMRSEAKGSYLASGVIFRPTRSFLGCSRPWDGFETDRDEFVGRYRSLANPIAVETRMPDRRPCAPRQQHRGAVARPDAGAGGDHRLSRISWA